MGRASIVREGQLEEEDLEEIVHLLNGDSGVTDLCLSWCYLIPADLEILGTAMERSETLRKLDLSHNFLGDGGVRTLLEYLGPSVETILLCDNDISDVGARLLIDRLTRLSCPLVKVDMSFNNISTKVAQRLERETSTKISRLKRGKRRPTGSQRPRDRLVRAIDALEAENKELRHSRGSLKSHVERMKAAKKQADQRAELAAQQLEAATEEVFTAQNETRATERKLAALQEQTHTLVKQMNALSTDSTFEVPPEAEQATADASEHALSFTCKICHDKAISCVFVPCGHLAACMGCGDGLRNCPICRALNTNVLRCFTT